MNRFSVLEQLMDNWPGRIDMNRIQLIERKTRQYPIADLSAAVDDVLETCTYPPTVKDFKTSLVTVSRRRANEASGVRERYKPGDIVLGEKTFTSAEAREELERLHEEHPEAFVRSIAKPLLGDPTARQRHFRGLMTRLYVSALRRCAGLDPERRMLLPTQNDLF